MKDGFTLLELLVVIALLGLVIAAVLVGMNGAKRKAYDTKALACSHDIRTAQERARTADQTFRPYAALGPIRSCEALTPEGGANTDHFLYAVKHPKGQVTYTVTDSDTYIGGTSRSGALLTADPAQLVLGSGGGGNAGGNAGGDLYGVPASVISQCAKELREANNPFGADMYAVHGEGTADQVLLIVNADGTATLFQRQQIIDGALMTTEVSGTVLISRAAKVSEYSTQDSALAGTLSGTDFTVTNDWLDGSRVGQTISVTDAASAVNAAAQAKGTPLPSETSVIYFPMEPTRPCALGIYAG